MPYVSAAQRGYFHANKAKLEAQGVDVGEWDRASKGKKLPYHVNRGGTIQSALNTARKYAVGGSVDTDPSEAQKEAGNYKKAHISFQGLPISIENPKGSTRSGVGKNGKSWSVKMPDHYGYIKRTEGADGDHIDVYVGPDSQSSKVFIIDQVHDDSKKFDEHKAMLGYRTQEEAVTAYRKAFSDGKGDLRIGAITPMSVDAFKSWLKGNGGKKPVGMFRGGKISFADGGEIESEKNPWLEDTTPEGRPRLTVHPAPPSPSELVSKYARKAADWFGQPSQIKPETPPAPEFNAAPDQQIGSAVRGIGQGMLEHYKELANPNVSQEDQDNYKNLPVPPAAFKDGKIPETTKSDMFTPILGEVISTFGGVPGQGMGWGLLKGATAGMMGAAAKTTAKSAVRQGFMDTSHFKSISLSKGTMPGGFKVDPATGTEWYVKQAPNLEQAKNEKLTAELYKLFGVPVADVHLTTVGGKPGIASKKIEGKQLSEFQNFDQIRDLHENYPVHALLANHDAVGTGPENPLGNIIVDDEGRAHVIDTGGGLLYKGTGAKKPNFNSEVNELDTMKDPSYSHLSAEVFGGVDHQAAMVGAQKIANVSGEDIAKLVELYGPSDKFEKFKLMSTLLQRKYNIEQEFGVSKGGSSAYTTPLKPEPRSAPAHELYEQIPFTEEEYEKFGQEIPPPLPDDVRAPKQEASKAGDEFTQLLMSGKKFDKKTLSELSKTTGSPWDAAHYLWEIADSINPQTAEALFRALPPKFQVDVGHRIAALKDSLDYSPWNSVAKGSGAAGKYPTAYDFYTTHTTKFKLPQSLLNDKKFINDLYEYSNLLEGTSAEIPKATESKEYEPISNGWANSWLNAPKEAQKLLEHFKLGPNNMVQDYDTKGIGSELAKIAGEYPTYADHIYFKIPTHLKQAVTKAYGDAKAELQAAKTLKLEEKAKTGDFTKEEGKTAALNHENNPIGIEYIRQHVLKPIPNWRNWKPTNENISKPHFPSENKRIVAENQGYNTNFEIHKGGDFDPNPEHPDYPTSVPDPSEKKYERAWFASDEIQESNTYGPGVIGGSYIARANKAVEFNWPDLVGMKGYQGTAMHNVVEAARKEGADIVAIHGLRDQSGVIHTQYAVINTAILRAPKAKFELKNMHKSWPLAGVAGGGLFTYGAVSEGQEKDKMNRGGIPALLHRAKKLASGGSADKSGGYHPRHPAGMIKSSIPGRTDKIPMSVPPGSYILPADIPSALGQGNTLAGEKILGIMFRSGPNSPGSTAQLSGKLPKGPRPPRMPHLQMIRPIRSKFADGGETEDVPIIAAGGEWVVHPDQVKEVGHGDLNAGHRVLDKFVLSVRKRHIETLKSLKPPKT